MSNDARLLAVAVWVAAASSVLLLSCQERVSIAVGRAESGTPKVRADGATASATSSSANTSSGADVGTNRKDCAGRPRATSSGLLMPSVLQRVQPDISKCAGRRASGNPVIEAVIDRGGNVASVRVVSDPNTCAAQAAADAVKRWKFCPAERDGELIEATMQVTVNINYR